MNRVKMPENLPERAIKTLQEWAAAVKQRDKACRKCGRSEDLHAHHLMPKSTHPELRLDIENGVTLCYRCHKAEHEKHRPRRVRTTKTPQRKTLLLIIDRLQAENNDLREQIAAAKPAAKKNKSWQPRRSINAQGMRGYIT